MELYARQKSLNLKVSESAAVLGAGGIGSWVSLFLSLVGVKKIIVIDPDKIEEHNLNRTPYTYGQIGEAKAIAIAQLIYERRPNVEVVPIIGTEVMPHVKELLRDVDIIVDCRDHEEFFDDEELQKKVVAKLGYDGIGMTITFRPQRPSWGEDPHRYTITPSYLVPPVFLAAVIVDAITRQWVPDEEKVVTFEDGVKEVVLK